MDQITVWAVSRFNAPDTLGSYQQKSREVLLALRDLDDAFKHLTVIGTGQAAVVPHDLEGLEDLIQVHVFSDGHPDDYLEALPDGRLGARSLSRIGFSLSYSSSGEDGHSIIPPERGGVGLTLQGGSAGIEPNAHVQMKLPTDEFTDIHRKEVVKRVLQVFLGQWQCNLGGVVLKKYQQPVKGNAPASYAGQWLFYLPFPHLAKCLPADIRHEPFANGILIETTPHMPDANNPSDVVAGKRVRDVLDEFGLVNDATYAIEGWPPDREETLYEQFISGAPADRKYTVHCVNFDGYDPDRKVLLYAKLFRRLRRHPKEWGFRGWDGPVLNEAKRQVRAAAKAGGVPIEWHIGLEEPAHQVRQLLADHTDITEQQLRVIFTPLEEVLSSPPP